MTDQRYKNRLWIIETDENGRVKNDQALIAVMMDVRDELWAINDKMNKIEFQTALQGLQEFGAHVRSLRYHARKRRKQRQQARGK